MVNVIKCILILLGTCVSILCTCIYSGRYYSVQASAFLLGHNKVESIRSSGKQQLFIFKYNYKIRPLTRRYSCLCLYRIYISCKYSNYLTEDFYTGRCKWLTLLVIPFRLSLLYCHLGTLLNIRRYTCYVFVSIVALAANDRTKAVIQSVHLMQRDRVMISAATS